MLRKIRSLFILAGAVLASSMIPGGCPFLSSTDPYQLVDPYEADPTNAKTNNNDFPRASKIDMSKNSFTIDAVLTLGDVDVYDLGAFSVGDELTVDMSIPDRVLLNASVGIFDSVHRLFYLTGEWADIASKPLTDVTFPAFTPKFTFTVRQSTAPLYLAIASQAQDRTGSGDYTGLTGGPYTIKLSVNRLASGASLPPPISQVVALQFDNSVVDYPPKSSFGQLKDLPSISFAGMNGLVLDPAWWRSFMILRQTIAANPSTSAFWTNFLTFANTINQGFVGQTTAPQAYGFLVAELPLAIQTATSDPASFTPTNTQWFGANGFPWLDLLAQYLGPAPVGATAAYLDTWDTVLPGTYPTTLDQTYNDAKAATAAIKAKMQADYAGLNVDFRVVGVDQIPIDVPVSTVYFVSNSTGTLGNQSLFGLSSPIDMGNSNHTDFSVVWAGEIGYFNARAIADADSNFLQGPSQGFNYVGSTGSHELGHILGLVHTDQPGDIMNRLADFQADLTATFGNAPLSPQMFPIGTQDSYLLLLLELGLAP